MMQEPVQHRQQQVYRKDHLQVPHRTEDLHIHKQHRLDTSKYKITDICHHEGRFKEYMKPVPEKQPDLRCDKQTQKIMFHEPMEVILCFHLSAENQSSGDHQEQRNTDAAEDGDSSLQKDGST